jgi:hypothetical protein
MDNLAKEPERRAQGARAFAAQLAAAAREAGITISEVGVVARLSNVDFGRVALDPTLDDAQLNPNSLVPSDPADRRGDAKGKAGAPEGRASPIVTATEAISVPSRPAIEVRITGNPASGGSGAGVTSTPSSPSPDPNQATLAGGDTEKRRSSVPLMLLSLLLGVALTIIATQYLAKRGDDGHAAVVKRARRALADGRYVNPPGDNVRELVASGLAKYPDDLELAQVRAEAAHEMVTRALAASAGGDVGGARDLVHDALELDPSDHSARTLLGQYQQETDALGTDAGMYGGPPKVTFKTTPLARFGQSMDLTAQIAPGSDGPKAKITGAKITLFENGKTTGGIAIPIVATGPHSFRATMTTPKTGSYDITFEAAVDGRPIRAQRDLDVLP